MKHFILALLLTGCLLTGCRSPMPKVLAQNPQWEKRARGIAEDQNSDKSGLKREPFPDTNNTLHREIWKALWKNGDVGDGMGSICSYYGHYLVTLSDLWNRGRVSYFYDPIQRRILEADVHTAYRLYRGDKSATLENARRLVAHLVTVMGYETISIEAPDDIPHTAFQGDNPSIKFGDYLLSKGITVKPPQFLQKNEDGNRSAYSECNLFVYVRLAGQLFRYEIRCEQGRIVAVSRFLLCSDVGDCWYIM